MRLRLPGLLGVCFLEMIVCEVLRRIMRPLKSCLSVGTALGTSFSWSEERRKMLTGIGQCLRARTGLMNS